MRHKIAPPTEALMTQPSRLMVTRRNTPLTVASGLRSRSKCNNKPTLISAAAEEPVAVMMEGGRSDQKLSAAPRLISPHRLATKEPSQIPGQTRKPHKSSPAIATPAGGHTAVTTPSAMAKINPSRAVAT